jgi:hypothetical protein
MRRTAYRHRGRWVAMGAVAAVDHIGDWALRSLPARPPSVPSVTVFPPALLAIRAADFERMRAGFIEGMGGDAEVRAQAEAAFDRLVAALREIERIDLEVEADDERCALRFTVTPRSGSGVAAWIAAGQPATFEMIARLHTEGTMALFAGRDVFRVSGLAAGLRGGISPVALEGPALGGLAARLGEIEQMLQRESAMTFDATPVEAPEGPSVHFALLSAIGAGSVDARRREHDAAGQTGEAVRHDGVVIEQWSKIGPEVRVAWWDDVAGLVMGTDSRGQIERLIDASRGKGARTPLPPSFAAAVDQARARGDSLVLVVDAVALLTGTPGEEGVIFALGFKDGKLVGRLELTARQVASVKALRRMAADGQQVP